MALKAIPTKRFRITYLMEVYVEAETEEQAKKTVDTVDRDVLNDESSFVKITSVEEIKP